MGFNINEFMQTSTTDNMATEYAPVPEGEYPAVITKTEGRETKTGKAIMDVFWKIDAPDAEDANERQVRQSIFLDMSDGGALLTGKGMNVQLGRLREAIGQNIPGQPWAPSMLEGMVALILVKQRFGEGEYEGKVYVDVKGVTKLS